MSIEEAEKWLRPNLEMSWKKLQSPAMILTTLTFFARQNPLLTTRQLTVISLSLPFKFRRREASKRCFHYCFNNYRWPGFEDLDQNTLSDRPCRQRDRKQVPAIFCWKFRYGMGMEIWKWNWKDRTNPISVSRGNFWNMVSGAYCQA